jgi:hypothetical protein
MSPLPVEAVDGRNEMPGGAAPAEVVLVAEHRERERFAAIAEDDLEMLEREIGSRAQRRDVGCEEREPHVDDAGHRIAFAQPPRPHVGAGQAEVSAAEDVLELAQRRRFAVDHERTNALGIHVAHGVRP